MLVIANLLRVTDTVTGRAQDYTAAVWLQMANELTVQAEFWAYMTLFMCQHM